MSDASKDSFASTLGNFAPYDESVEATANEEAMQYAMVVAEEEEPQQQLRRFSGEVDVRQWFLALSSYVLAQISRKEAPEIGLFDPNGWY